MNYDQLMNLLNRVHGCTFASMDSVTSPSSGITKVTKGEQVILFSNTADSGYESMIRRRLKEFGRDPNTFVVSDLPWGTRVENLPIIAHKGRFYLQAVRLYPGEVKTFIGSREVSNDLLDKSAFKWNQQLPKEKQVEVRTYALDNITRMRLLKEEVL